MTRPYALGTAALLVLIALFSAFQIHQLMYAPHISQEAALLPGVLAALTNSDRNVRGVAPLLENPLLDKAAQLKAEDMAAKSYYAHVSPEGYLPFHWLDAVGYKYLNVGENLDLQYAGSETDTETGVNTAFVNSPEHLSNILLPQFTEIGIGVASGMYNGRQATFIVEFFATPYPLAVFQAPLARTPPSVSTSSPKLESKLPKPLPSNETTHSSGIAASTSASTTEAIPRFSPADFAAALRLFIDSLQKATAEILHGLEARP